MTSQQLRSQNDVNAFLADAIGEVLDSQIRLKEKMDLQSDIYSNEIG